MRILGTNFFNHDSAVFLLDTTQREIFALSTERCTRIKHDGLDVTAILREHPIDDVDFVAQGYADYTVEHDVFQEAIDDLLVHRAHRALMKPRYASDFAYPPRWRKWLRIAGKAINSPNAAIRYGYVKLKRRFAPEFISSPGIIRFIRSSVNSCGIHPRSVDLYDHHLCHAASAYYFSPHSFERPATVLTIDGYGDLHFSKCYRFDGNSHKLIGCSRSELMGKHQTSIGFIYGCFTEALGFRPNSDEGKVEALAAYGQKDPKLFATLRDCVSISAAGFRFDTDKARKFYDLDFLRSQIERAGKEACAASVQRWLEDIVVEYLNLIHAEHDLPPVLCLAGGVCANIIMTLNIMERTPFKSIYTFPAMADDGVAAGAAVLKALEIGEDVSWLKMRVMPYYGPRIEEGEIIQALSRTPSVTAEKLGTAWPEHAAKSLASGKIVAVAHGRMEYGPRALGNRSILANPFNPKTRERLNLLVKRRPPFQPFCPSILEEERQRLFEASFPHKHMATAFRMRKEFCAQLPCAVHVDGTARPQFVEERDNAEYYRLLREFKRLTGFGVLINTSFNLHGRTIVRTAKDAIRDFVDCGIDELYLEGYRITRVIAPARLFGTLSVRGRDEQTKA
jgi:carbamoyltransferase